MDNLVFAVVNPATDEIGGPTARLRDLTIAFSRYGYNGEIVEANNLDQVLRQACQQEVNSSSPRRFCLVQRAGHVIDEQWYLSHWPNGGFYRGISQLMEQADFVIAGQLIQGAEGTLGLYDDCLLVDLSRYQALGMPGFGEADDLRRTLPIAHRLPNDGDVLQPAATGLKLACDVTGWALIDQALKQGMQIRSFATAINQNRLDLFDEQNCDEFNALIGKAIDAIDDNSLTSAQRSFIKRLSPQVNNAQKGVFLLNIESYEDLPDSVADQPALDAVFSVAAGFKPYRILHTQGVHDDTQVVLFDYSRQALAVRRTIIEEWDGDNFPEFVKQLFERHPEPDVFYQLWTGVTSRTLDWQDMQILWHQELDKWGGAAAFKRAWQRYRALPHQYLHCDLLADRQALMQRLGQYGNTYIWWSNAFFTVFSHWHYTFAERQKIYQQWLQELAEVAPNCLINGADNNNVAVNGVTADQYWQAWQQQQYDELKPLQINQTAIRF